MGISGIDLPLVEFGIALSVIVLGAALLAARKYPVAIAAIAVGAMGFVHGHAHGAEMPVMAEPALYAAGFITATALLHLAGIAAGLSVVGRQRWAISLRLSGAAISAAGVAIVCGLIAQ
jgi:urease accessory protein